MSVGFWVFTAPKTESLGPDVDFRLHGVPDFGVRATGIMYQLY